MADNDADSDEVRALRPLLQAAACTYRIAFGPRAGQKVLTVQGTMPREPGFKHDLCADINGFSLHAAVRCGADERQAPEQLCRYITRPALANERVPCNAAGQVVLKLKTQFQWRLTCTQVMSQLRPLARRHHAPGDVAAGVHAALGCPGAEAALASDPLPWCAGTQCQAAPDGGAASARRER